MFDACEQLTSMLQGQASQSETDKAERLQHLAAIQELQRQHGQLARERDEARTEAGERQREMTGLRQEVNSVIDKKRRLVNLSSHTHCTATVDRK